MHLVLVAVCTFVIDCMSQIMNVSSCTLHVDLDESMDSVNSSEGSKNPEQKEDTENGIPKMNMKFDGNSWQHCEATDRAINPNTEQTEAGPSTSSASAHTKDEQPKIVSTLPNPSSPSSSLSNDEGDQEFEPSADAMVHDFDDEATMEEEEEEEEADSEELDDLAKEGDMPLEDLMALYYGNRDGPQENAKEPGTGSEISQSPSEENDGESKNDNVEDLTRKLRSNATNFLSPPHQHQDSDGEDFDGDYAPPLPEDWKKAPRVGEDYQVNSIPEVEQQKPYYDDSTDRLVWDPAKISSDKVESYLEVVSMSGHDQNQISLPDGAHLRDNEDALFLLTQCSNNTEEAIQRFKWRPPSLANEMHVWSEEECRQFELGLSLYGKDFHAIHHNKVKTKAIGDIVKFYYIWKKTERYDNFNAKTRLGKKNTLHPGVTDYMERLLDETEQATSSLHNSLLTNHGAASSSHPGPLPHSTALQQHLIDLRVSTRSNTRHRPHNHYGESPPDDYSEMNGLLDSDFVDDPAIFENIAPIPTHSVANLGNISPSVPFTAIEPSINVGYSDAGQFAPVATTVEHPAPAGDDAAATSQGGDVIHFQAAEVGGANAEALADQSKHSFRPLDPAEITPTLPPADGVAEAARRTTPLPQDVLSSIDELESTYCKPAKQNSKDGVRSDSSSSSSRSSCKHPVSPDPLTSNAKRSRMMREDPLASEPHQSLFRASSSSETQPPHSSSDATSDERSSSSSAIKPSFQSTSSSAGREKISDPPQLISC